MEIRDAQVADVPALLELHEQLQAHLERTSPRLWAPERNICQVREASYRELIADPLCALFVAEDGGVVIGFLGGRIVERDAERPRKVGLVHTAVVREGWRRRGVGTALMRRLVEFFRAGGVEEASVRYIVGNEEGERFWRGLGFEPIIVTANTALDELARRVG